MQEIDRLCKKFSANDKIKDKAKSYLRRVNNRTKTLGQLDMFKYLACVDLAYRATGGKWDQSIADKCGGRAKSYPRALQSLSNLLNITTNTPQSVFQDLARKFGCKHIVSRFSSKFDIYCQRKMDILPPVQRAHANFRSNAHFAAVFFVVAGQASIKLDKDALCRAVCCDRNRFGVICKEVAELCPASRKRKFGEMKDTDRGEEISEGTDDNDMYQDSYVSRKKQKDNEWRNKIVQRASKKCFGTKTPKLMDLTNPRKQVTLNKSKGVQKSVVESAASTSSAQSKKGTAKKLTNSASVPKKKTLEYYPIFALAKKTSKET